MKKRYLIQYAELIREWHTTKNGDLKPHNVTPGLNKKVQWKCDKGDDHEWEAAICDRAQGSGCPYCAGKKASKLNNLAYVNPKLAKEWHPTKNGDLKSHSVTPCSGKKVWWKCDKGDDHEWEAIVVSRDCGKGCPYCSGYKVSKTNNLAHINSKLAEEWHPTKNGDLKPHNVTPGSGKKVWWKCNKGDNHEWEAAIYNRAQGSGCPRCKKR